VCFGRVNDKHYNMLVPMHPAMIVLSRSGGLKVFQYLLYYPMVGNETDDRHPSRYGRLA